MSVLFGKQVLWSESGDIYLLLADKQVLWVSQLFCLAEISGTWSFLYKRMISLAVQLLLVAEISVSQGCLGENLASFVAQMFVLALIPLIEYVLPGMLVS